jgi:hypothetical protein
VQFAHTGNDGLARLFVGTHTERRIFRSQTTQRQTHLFLVGLGLRLDGNVNHRLREDHALEDDRRIRITQGFTGGDFLQADAAAMSPARTSLISRLLACICRIRPMRSSCP